MKFRYFLTGWSAIICIEFIVLTLPSNNCSNLEEEEEFVKHFGNNPNSTVEWPTIKQYFNDVPHQTKLRKFVTGAHKKLPNFNCNIDVKSLSFKKATLKFNVEKYLPMRVEVLGYGLSFGNVPKHLKKSLNIDEDDRWYMMPGRKKDCVYFLTSIDSSAMEFNLDKHICGVRYKF